MTSEERHEVRYKRRKQRREQKKNAKLSRLGTYDDIFSYGRLYDAFYECEKEVRWKGSVQSYEATLPLSTLEIYNTLKARKFKPMGFLEFDLCERGKMRHIRALNIAERCIQRSLCDNYLLPLLEPQLIYDNGASVKDKGIDFSMKRLKCHLSRYYRKYHTNEGYVLQYDFSSYFDNINHDILLRQLKRFIYDKEIYQIVESMIKCFGDKGLGLGSQVSQIAAIFYPTLLDKVFKEKLKVKGYARYMDDGIIICHNLDEVEKYKQVIFDVCQQLDININTKKLTVSKLSKTFIFLKKRVRLTNSGKIIVRISRQAVTRANRRLRKLSKKAANPAEKFNYVDLYQCYKSWLGAAKKLDNYFICQRYRQLFYRLISQYHKQEQIKTREKLKKLIELGKI